MNGRVESTGPIVHGVLRGREGTRTTHCGIRYVQLYVGRDETDEEIDCMACIAVDWAEWTYAYLGDPWP